MGLNLYAAHDQWANRPADERFWTLEEMLGACKGYAEHARTASVKLDGVRCEDREGSRVLVGREDRPAHFTHWSFGQLASRVQAPAGYLRTLPAPLAADCINNGLSTIKGEESTILLHSNGSLVCRAFTSEDYSRIWNWEIAQRLMSLPQQGWQVPPARPAMANQSGARPATEEDILERRAGLSVKVGDLIAPAGLYASDHDMFAFMVNEQIRIEDGTEGGLARGFFVSNSEVGAAAFKITKFLYKFVCGNHIVWDAKEVKEIRIVHRGSADRRYAGQLVAELWKYARESSAGDEQRIEAARRFEIGSNKDEVLDRLFGIKSLGIPWKTLDAAYEHVVRHPERYKASPRSAYGMANGLTAISQETNYADDRTSLDRAAGRVLSMAF
ncbi:MAG TPA: DUF932 domain-containing protein [Caulifigura sp.]|jgi:hypothetical protein|nr:DUF932 domain-containing protein [Caulifigura sp.]